MALLLVEDPARTYLVALHEGESAVVGRSPTCDIIVTADRASRRHAEIRPGAVGGHAVVDLGSTNGTRLDGLEVGAVPQPLAEGAQVAIGGCRISYRRGSPSGDAPR